MGYSTKTATATISKAIQKSIDYATYRDLVHQLALTNATTGPLQVESLIDYTQLNDKRMHRWDKTIKISDGTKVKLAKLSQKITWLVITESWCGDASPSLPVMNAMAQLNANIDLRIVLRDEHEDLMNLFLTNGSRSIPKLIMLEADNNSVLGEWGPRPSKATAMANDYKDKHGELSAAFKQDLQVWYNKDRGQNIQDDLVKLLPLE
ncbi:MAG: thioredoxin family protein [Croceitalea sp.]|nr:thioredoxin family protein [Croceitalea sp.]NNL09331.1 thioredoxin family protein [Croceitalea sp.]